jgi:hypothetical protein
MTQPKVEERMKKANCIVALIGMGLAMASWAARAQAPAAPTAIPADQQATKEQLAKLFELMRVRDQVASLAKTLPTIMQQQMTAQMSQMQKDHPEMAPMPQEQNQALAKIESEFMERVMNLYTSDEMIADMAGIYQKHMTRSDVDGIIGFYKSPAGQHLLDMQPVILQEYMPLMMQRMQDRIKPLTDEMTKEMMEIIKSKAPSGNKPAQK